MEPTNNSKFLLSFFMKKKCISVQSQSRKTKNILTHIYSDLEEAHSYIEREKQAGGQSFYKVTMQEIKTVAQIPRPQKFTSDSFPKEIRERINDHVNTLITYSFSLFNRKIKFHFVIEDGRGEVAIEKYHKYVDVMLKWIYILNQYASSKCSKEFTVYLYFTHLLKKLPESNIHVLGGSHVNTAFTTTCPQVSEIVIYRKEEWFKVFMHETFHNFALDFSDMNTEECTRTILDLFPVKSEVNLFEAYTEFWAEIMNACFCSFILVLKDAHDNGSKKEHMIEEFLSHCDFFIHMEQVYSFFQMIKALRFMGLLYKDLYSKGEASAILRETMYKEESNVLSYYVIKLILMNNYQGFLNWCNTNNTSLLQFKKTTKNQRDFCDFIEKNHKTRSMLDGVVCTEKILAGLEKNKYKLAGIEKQFLMKNMRMSICEMG